jgi:hypothetical protein
MQYLTQSDTASQITAELTRHDTGAEVPLTGHTVSLKFRKRGTNTVLFTVIGTGSAGDLAEGKVNFDFADNLVDLDPGFYEGEIEITYSDATVESVYEIIKFQVREDF